MSTKTTRKKTTTNGHRRSAAPKFRIRIVGFQKQRAGAFKFNPLNFRRHGEAQRDALRTMLGDVGWVQGVIVNKRTGNLIDGHARIEECLRDDPKQLVPYLLVDLSPAEEKAVLATLDPIGAMAEIDPATLDQLYKETVIDMPGLEQLLASLHHQDNGQAASNHELSPSAAVDGDVYLERAAQYQKKWRTKVGQMWSIGSHRLVCGDATDPAVVKKLMGRERADCVFTSPPYGSKRNYTNPIKDWTKLMTGVFGALLVRPDAQLLVNLGMIHTRQEWSPYWDEWIEWMRTQGWRRFGLYVWDQGPGIPGNWSGRLAPSFELIFHFNRTTRAPKKTVPCVHAGTMHPTNRHGLRKADGSVGGFTHAGQAVQDFKIPDNVLRVLRDHNTSALEANHPARFPPALPQEVLATYCQELAFEPFAGSGSTLVAAERLGLRCFALELAPSYCGLILERLALAFPKLKINQEG